MKLATSSTLELVNVSILSIFLKLLYQAENSMRALATTPQNEGDFFTRTMEVRTGRNGRYGWYGFGTVFQFQYQLGTNSVRFFRSSTNLVLTRYGFSVPVPTWYGLTFRYCRNCLGTVGTVFFQKFRKMRNSTENFLNENNML